MIGAVVGQTDGAGLLQRPRNGVNPLRGNHQLDAGQVVLPLHHGKQPLVFQHRAVGGLRQVEAQPAEHVRRLRTEHAQPRQRRAAVGDAHLVHEKDLAAQVTFERGGLARRGQQPERARFPGRRHHGEDLHDPGGRAGEHRDASLAGTQRRDVVGRHALEKVGAVGVGQHEHAGVPARQHSRTFAQGGVFIETRLSVDMHDHLGYIVQIDRGFGGWGGFKRIFESSAEIRLIRPIRGLFRSAIPLQKRQNTIEHLPP